MTYDLFIESIREQQMPDGLSVDLQSLWVDAIGDWDQAHELSQLEGTKSGDRIHAYLHRKEGDYGNAAYWYHRSGENMPSISLEQEWSDLVKRFIPK